MMDSAVSVGGQLIVRLLHHLFMTSNDSQHFFYKRLKSNLHIMVCSMRELLFNIIISIIFGNTFNSTLLCNHLL